MRLAAAWFAAGAAGAAAAGRAGPVGRRARMARTHVGGARRPQLRRPVHAQHGRPDRVDAHRAPCRRARAASSASSRSTAAAARSCARARKSTPTCRTARSCSSSRAATKARCSRRCRRRGPSSTGTTTSRVRKGHKLLGRDIVVIDVRPKDGYRYGYRLWLDEETAMPLRSVVGDGAGRQIEQILFTRLETQGQDPGEGHRAHRRCDRVPVGPHRSQARRDAAAAGQPRLAPGARAAGFPPGREPAAGRCPARRCRRST